MIAHSGIGTYLRSVLPRLLSANPGWRFTLLGDPAALRQYSDGSRVTVVACDAPIYGVREQLALRRLLPRDATVHWSPHYNIPLLTSVPLVVTVHDVAHLRLEEYAGLLRRGYARLMLGAVRARAAAVMFVSEFTRREFEALAGTPNGIAETIPSGLSDDWLSPRDAGGPDTLAGPYFVYVGNAKPHKNLGVLLDAFAAVRDELGAQLVIIGATSGFRTGDDAVVARLRQTAGVRMPGRVDDPGLRRYLRGATALVLPSRYEGFGYPPLEAMALGCPAIVSNAASLPETCGDAAAYFSPANAAELAQLLARVTRDAAFRDSLIRRGTTRVRMFDAGRTADRVAGVMARVSNG